MPSVKLGPEINDRRLSAIDAHIGRFIFLATGVACFNLLLWAQTPAPQPSDANQSWTATTESHSNDANATRTLESHVQDGNRILEKRSLQWQASDGHFEPYRDIEKETVQVNSTTVRITIRIFGRDGGGAKTLLEITEEEKQSLPGGDSKSVRATLIPDTNGNLQETRREIADTKKISRDVGETKTTVMLPSVNGGLAPAMQVEERQQRTGNNTEFQKTMQLLDGGGNWQVKEVRQGTIKEEPGNRSTEERVSSNDFGVKLDEVARTVTRDSERSSGEKRNIQESYSIDLLGSPIDGKLHMVQRVTSTQSTDSSGQQTVMQQVEQPNPGDPTAGLRVTSLSTDTVRSGPSGAQATRTIQVPNGGGNFEVFSVDTTESNSVHAIQVQIAPSNKPW